MNAPGQDPILLDQTDIWVTTILPFLGPGYYLFVAGINCRFKELYLEYFSRIPIQKIPKVINVLRINVFGGYGEGESALPGSTRKNQQVLPTHSTVQLSTISRMQNSGNKPRKKKNA